MFHKMNASNRLEIKRNYLNNNDNTVNSGSGPGGRGFKSHHPDIFKMFVCN